MYDLTCRRGIASYLFSIGAALLFGTGVLAQAPKSLTAPPSIQEAKVLVNQAYLASRSAKTLAEYNQIVESLQRALTAPLAPETAQYARTLLAWGHNRRGESWSDEALVASRRGDEARAIELDARAMGEFEASVKLDEKKWKAWHNLGVSHALAGQREAAIADFDRSVRLYRDYANTWFNRGQLHAEAGRLDEALADLNRAFELAPKDAGVLVARGRLLARQRKFDAALADCTAAIQLSPKGAEPITARADLYFDLGKWELAAADYKRAIGLDPNYGPAYCGSAWLLATCPDEAFFDPKLALASAQKAISLDGDSNPRYLDTLAAAQAATGDYASAKATVTKALAIAPADMAERMNVRLALYEREKPFRESPRKQ